MAEPKQCDRPQPRPWRVLVAEDDALLANTVDDFLSDEGFAVVIAGDGREALECAHSQTFDVLLTDLRMPHLDGIQLIRALRASRPDLPVVVMSANAPVDLRSMVAREGEGPLVLITKPMRLSHLLQALKGILNT